ncbi:MAG: hypothetical protein JW889_14280 [Verrucomicrobia bacterium]|nr:hypothetical protein [Verrucomicrobiota bacterium]
MFDSIVTENLIRHGCENEVPFEFGTSESPGERCYSAGFVFGPDYPNSHAYVSVTVARAGKLLDLREYHRFKRKVRMEDKDQPHDMQWGSSLFPDIGRRAMVGLVLSPNGGGDAVVFTTSDGRFDIKVEQGNHLAKGLEGPNVLCGKIAREVCRLYGSKPGR